MIQPFFIYEQGVTATTLVFCLVELRGFALAVTFFFFYVNVKCGFERVECFSLFFVLIR